MNNKEFIAFISQKLKISKKETSKLSKILIDIFSNTLKKEKELEILGFGKFVKEDDEKIKFIPDKEFIEEINQR